ncbi:MAG: hypothetical protein U1F43_04535 [Myxococcota bacterium]
MRLRRSLAGLALPLSLLALPLAAPGAAAKSWCAYPLWVHEWGVHVFDGAGRAQDASALLPDFFHRSVPGSAGASGPSVRDLPPDGGERDLPVVHFYSPRRDAHIPVGLEVGFTGGPASVWYPQIDLFRTAADANGVAAAAARARLLLARAARANAQGGPALPPDPTRQLIWNDLELTTTPPHAPAPTKVPWVEDVRRFDALWASTGGESERFVFYEAQSDEKLPLELRRGNTFGPGRRHYELHNLGAQPVHDVFVVHREPGHVYVFFAPQIPARSSAGFLLEEHEVAAADLAKATDDQLRASLVDAAAPAAPSDYRWDMDHCVMQRDPAVPVESAEGYRLYRSEVDAILKVWGNRFFGRTGTTIVYREDPATLDAAMPLSVYTDMYNFVVLRRAGLALWESVVLP